MLKEQVLNIISLLIFIQSETLYICVINDSFRFVNSKEKIDNLNLKLKCNTSYSTKYTNFVFACTSLND